MRPDWADFYEGLAKAIGKHTGPELYRKIRELSSGNPWLSYMHFENVELWQERGHSLDPFSVMGIFNRGQTDAHREEIAAALARTFGVDLVPPSCYHGIPYLDPRKSIYDGDQEMWNLYNSAGEGPQSAQFQQAWDKAIAVHGNGLGTLSIGLFWIRPDLYMAVDRVSSPCILEITGIKSPSEKCTGAEYGTFLKDISEKLRGRSLNYAETAFVAWQETHGGATC